MKKLSYITAALALILALSSCGNKAEPKQTSAQQTEAPVSASAQDNANAGSSGKTESTAAPVIPGVLYSLNLKDGEEPVIKGIRLTGNRIGSGLDNGINSWPVSAEKVRFIFALDEWISIELDTAKDSDAFHAYIVPHKESEETLTDTFVEMLAGNEAVCDLNRPDSDDWKEWGSLYLFSEDWPEGNYDLVITDGVTPVARVLLNMYNEAALNDKSDKELEKMMSDAVNAAKG